MQSTSVVIPTCNRASLLADSLKAVFAQTVQPDEVILIDDGSTDNTPDVAARYPQVRYAEVEVDKPHALRFAESVSITLAAHRD